MLNKIKDISYLFIFTVVNDLALFSLLVLGFHCIGFSVATMSFLQTHSTFFSNISLSSLFPPAVWYPPQQSTNCCQCLASGKTHIFIWSFYLYTCNGRPISHLFHLLLTTTLFFYADTIYLSCYLLIRAILLSYAWFYCVFFGTFQN